MTHRQKIARVRELADMVIRASVTLSRAYDRRAAYDTQRKNAERAQQAFKVVQS